jgi:glycosyltransferase involved in cell wall biosynthesis
MRLNPVSVVIPVFNGGADLAALLTSLRAQNGIDLQVLVLDSGSTDGSDELARQFPETEWHRWRAADFSHSATRNRGVGLTRHPLVLCTVQDARFEPGALAQLAALMDEHGLAALSAAERPRADADAFARYSLHSYYRSLGLDGPRTVVHSRWEGTGREKMNAASIGNVACLYRRSALVEHPFQGAFAEDFDWAVRALVRGDAVGKTSETTVTHSHTRPAFYAMKRGYASRKLMRRFEVAARLKPRTEAEALGLIASFVQACGAAGARIADDAGLERFIETLKPWPPAVSEDWAAVVADCEPFDDGNRPAWTLKALAGHLGWLLGDVDWTGERGKLIEALADGL